MLTIITGVIKSSAIYCLHYMCYILPRNKKIWLYSSLAGSFTDNAKYFFLYAREHHSNIRHIWLTDSVPVINYLTGKGIECYHKKSWRGIILSLRAKVFIYSSYSTDVTNPAYTGGAFLFNLWHGIPLKMVEYDIKKWPLALLYNPKGLMQRIKRFAVNPPITKKHSAILTTSVQLKQIFSRAFKVSEQNVLIAQYPRVIPFYWNTAELENHITSFEDQALRELLPDIKHFTETWIYMPTWRDGNPQFVSQALSDIRALNEVCQSKQILLLLKMHINTKFNVDISQYSNIRLIHRSIDVYPLLPLTTTLITDYSSIFFDYSLLKKRIIFYPYDLASYKSLSRDFYFDYRQIISGREVVYSFRELLQHINNPAPVNASHTVFTEFITDDNNFEKPVRFVKKAVGIP